MKHLASENSDCTQQALTHNIRTTGEIKYLTGDNAFTSKSARSRWPTGSIETCSFYLQVHPC